MWSKFTLTSAFNFVVASSRLHTVISVCLRVLDKLLGKQFMIKVSELGEDFITPTRMSYFRYLLKPHFQVLNQNERWLAEFHPESSQIGKPFVSF